MDDPASRAQQRVLILAFLIAAGLIVVIFTVSRWYPTLMSTDPRTWMSFAAMAGAAILLAVFRLRNPRR
jgi:uncharacterized membrane protein